MQESEPVSSEIYQVLEEYIYFAGTPDIETAKIVRCIKAGSVEHRLFFFDGSGKRIFSHLPTNNISAISLEDLRAQLMQHMNSKN